MSSYSICVGAIGWLHKRQGDPFPYPASMLLETSAGSSRFSTKSAANLRSSSHWLFGIGMVVFLIVGKPPCDPLCFAQ